MTENEAAATPEPSKPEPSGTVPSGTGERPRPRYGEMAPEGWDWKPPAPPAAEPATPPQPVAPQPAPPVRAPAAGPGAGSLAANPLRTDRRITIALLVLGLFGLWIAISTLNAIPEALQMLHTQQNLADYVASESDMRSILIGNVLQGILWIATASWALLRMQHGRRAFWVPLIGGALSVILLFVVVSMVAANDPLLMQLTGPI